MAGGLSSAAGAVLKMAAATTTDGGTRGPALEEPSGPVRSSQKLETGLRAGSDTQRARHRAPPPAATGAGWYGGASARILPLAAARDPRLAFADRVARRSGRWRLPS